MANRLALRFAFLLLSLLLLSGCTQEEAVRKRETALTPAELRTIHFEQLSDWHRFSGVGTLASSTNHSEGAKSVSVSGMGYIAVRNLTPLTKDDQQTPQVVGYDIWIPVAQPNPTWHGDTQLTIDAPSAGVYQQYLGYRSLQTLPKGQWVHVEFPVPNAVRTALNAANYTDLRVIIAVNVPPGASTHYLDNFTLGPVQASCTPVSDNNVCTSDSCNPSNGQTIYTPVAPGTSCTDANACNGSEVCNATGVCQAGTPPTVDDGNACTADACSPSGGVTHTPVSAGTSCSDSNACNGAEVCNAIGLCQAGAPPVVDDGNVCTADACSPSGGVTHTPVSAGTSCADSNACNGAEVCNSTAVCQAGTPPVIDDGNVCTADACSPSGGVTHTPVSVGTSCSDSNACNGAEACNATGVCQAGTPPAVDDGNSCTVDTCSPSGGVTHTPAANGSSCSDGNLCTTVDFCQSGACVGSEPVECPGGDACQVAGVCDPETGACSGSPAPDGTPCDDGVACSAGDVCEAGECAGGSEPTTEEMPCHVAVCDEVTAGVVYLPLEEGSACSLDACSFGTCSEAGECVVTDITVTDDGDACTIDYCDPVLGAVHAPCSEIDPTVATTTLSAYKFLLDGSNPVQTGVAPGTIEERRAALLTGHVTSRAGAPLPSVKVRIHDRPELGETLTHADGTFMMVVNGGGTLQVVLHKAGYLDSSRRIDPQWNQTHDVEPVVMVAADPIVTGVTLDAGGSDFQVAQGSVSSDADGERRATLLLPPGVQAAMRHDDGTYTMVPEMHIRLTEFTVGDEGPEAMPASLPSMTAYTYAFEVNADEAVAVGAPEIEFSQPLPFYLENFLGFPAGSVVPLGSYSRERGVWIPHENGVVVEVVGIDSGVAALDITGDGVADGAAALANYGITEAERGQLASLYVVGTSLWRVQLPHFTEPYDINWPFYLPEDADPPGGWPPRDPDDPTDPDEPPPGPEDPDNPPRDPCEVDHQSTIECESQIYREAIDIPGTAFSLQYSSARAPGYGSRTGSSFRIPVTGISVPASLKRVDVEVEIAGRRLASSYLPVAGQVADFTWDGQDVLGRSVQGAQHATVRIAYVYDGVYAKPSRFGGYSYPGLTGNRTRQELEFAKTWKRRVGYLAPTQTGFGGWTLDAHHTYDPVRRALFRGDGTTVRGAILTTGGSLTTVWEDNAGARVAAGADGSFVTCVQSGATTQIRRLAPDGTVAVVDSVGLPAWASTCQQTWLTVAPSGDIYWSNFSVNAFIRRVRPDGSAAYIAGNGEYGLPEPGEPALEQPLPPITGLAADGEGNVYAVLSTSASRLYKIDPGGVVEAVTGPASPVPAFAVLGVDDVAVDPTTDEPIVVTRAGNAYSIVRLGRDGLPELLVGCQSGATCGLVPGAPANEFQLTGKDVEVGSAGELYFETPFNLWTVTSKDTVVPLLAQPGEGTFYESGMLASRFSGGMGPSWSPLGLAFVGTGPNFTLLLANALPGIGSERAVASKDGSEVYVFDEHYRHSRTLDGKTLATLFSLLYDTEGRLEAVEDPFGLRTLVERSPSGAPEAIVGPYGQRTELALDSAGYLASVVSPGERAYGMTYDESGLLLTLTDPSGGVSEMDWDTRGRLVGDRDSEGANMSLSREERSSGWTVTRTSQLGQVTSYDTERSPDGSDQRIVTLPDGTQSVTQRAPAGWSVSTLPDGTQTLVTEQPDPRWGITTPVRTTTTTLPSGLQKTVTRVRHVGVTDNPLEPTYWTDITGEGQASFQSDYDPTTNIVRHRSFENRISEESLDEFGRTIEMRSEGSPSIRAVYTDERVTESMIDPDATSGNGNERTTRLAYDSAGHLISVTDPLGSVTAFTDFDAAEHPGTIVLPDASEVQMSYDMMGNVTSVTPPGQAPHGMTYGVHGRIESYNPPAGNTVSYEYDLDRQLDLIDYGLDGSGQPARVDFAWDNPTGQLVSITSPAGTIDVGYTHGKATSLVTPSHSGSITTNATYDGDLPTSVGWSGQVSGQVSWTYDARFRVQSETIGALASTAITYEYDNDGLVTRAGDLMIQRDPMTGRVISKTMGNIREQLQYNDFGELARQTVDLMSGVAVEETLYDVIYDDDGVNGDRDLQGRITKKTERIVQGDTPGSTPRPLGSRTYDYGYNLDGRPWLETVAVDGIEIASYGYDANGNRTSVDLSWSQLGYHASMDAGLTDVDTQYNAADQLVVYGTMGCQWNNFGQLASKTDSASNETTSYEHDLYGNLLSVMLSDGRTVEYEVDGAGRRVGRRVRDAQGLELEYRGWIYRDLLRPIAEVDAAGTVVARYLYAGAISNPRTTAPEAVQWLDQAGNQTDLWFLIKDQVGSVRLAVNQDGAIVERHDYDPFGRILVLFDSLQPFGFGGGMTDGLTGLVRFGAREYDPTVGRWLSRDPALFGSRSMNLYAYVANSPIMLSDPSGLTFLEVDRDKGMMHVDPERPGESGYSISITSGKGDCMNKPECEARRDEGPIPDGQYELETAALTQQGAHKAMKQATFDGRDWGSFYGPLQPYSADTHGRDGFYLHGGAFSGSAGCIDVGGGFFGNEQTNRLIQDILSDPDGMVGVIVF